MSSRPGRPFNIGSDSQSNAEPACRTPKSQTDAAEPTLFIAIGGGGFIPARILRTFLKTSSDGGKKKNIPIQAVGLTLYEDMGGVSHLSRWKTIREGTVGVRMAQRQFDG